MVYKRKPLETTKMLVKLGRINHSTSTQWNGCFFSLPLRKDLPNVLLSDNSKVWGSVSHPLTYDICLKELKMPKKLITVGGVLVITWE